MGITSSFYIAQKGLQLSQMALEVVSHNVANVNTEGYSRQRLNLINDLPYSTRIGPMGTGVDATNITRMHDQYVVRNLIDKSALLAKFEAQKISIDAIESIFNESMGNGINEALSNFWNAWQEVADNPEANPERMNLLEKADTLSKSINQMRLDLDDINRDINRRIEESVAQANTLIREIADLNEAIVAQEAGYGHQANDLRDKREQHIKELSEILDINYFEDPRNGAVSILTPKGTPLVEDVSYWSLKAEADELTGDTHVLWERGNGGTVDISEDIDNGQIGGWLELRDEIMKEFYLQFEAFTESLIKEVNRQHAQGVGLANFDDLTSNYSISEYASFKTEFTGYDNNLDFTALGTGAGPEAIGIKLVKAGSQADQLQVVTNYVAGPPEEYNITVILPIDKNGQVTSTAEDVARAINQTRTPGVTQPAPFPPAAGPPYAAGDLIFATPARGERGDQIVNELIDTTDPSGFARLSHELQYALEFGEEIKWGFDYAQYETSFDGDNNDLVFAANPNWFNDPANPDPNATGEEISVQIVTGGPPISVNVLAPGDTDIIITAPAGTTANEIINFLNSTDPNAIEASKRIDVTRAAGNSGEGAVAAMTAPQFLDRSGSFDLVVYDRDGEPTITQIKVRPTDTKDDVIAQINAIEINGFKPISAGDHFETGNNYIRIQTEPGYEFAFANDTANALMALGFNTFFDGYNTSTIGLNDVIENDIRLIGTGRLDAEGLAQTGDNTNALDLADIKDQKFLIRNQHSTISESYNTLAAQVGSTTHAITRNHDFNASLVDQLHAQRDMVSAVNMDEEMADLMKFQYMYQASAKMISAVDELLQTLLAIK